MLRSARNEEVQKLKLFLDQTYDRYHRVEYLYSDPLGLVHHWSEPLDQECVGLIGALLAYGNVKQIRASTQKAIQILTDSGALTPSEAVRKLKDSDRKKWQGWAHRFNVGDDLWVLLKLLQKVWKAYGSLGNSFAQLVRAEDETIENALNLLVRDWRKQGRDLGALGSFDFLLTAPENGSCCKRWCMLLRWMGRKDALDLGLWKIDPSKLVMPLDTHTWRLSHRLGLVSRKTSDWKAALEVTASLKKLDPSDPTRYDFSLCRIGILDLHELALPRP